MMTPFDRQERQTRLGGLRLALRHLGGKAFRRGSHKCGVNCGRTISANKECCLACNQAIENAAADIPLVEAA